MPKGGFGNLIALPLQHGPRENGKSIFVDDGLQPYDDQWAFLSSIKRLAPDEIQALLRKMYPVGDVINIKHSARTEGWNTLRVTMTGERIECHYDGKKYLDVSDSTFTGPGKIHLWTKADAQTHFDDPVVIGN